MSLIRPTTTSEISSPGTSAEDKGGPALFLHAEPVEANTKADVLLTHGMGEYSGKYGHVGRFFGQHGYRLCSYDLRGHGRSPGRRGHIRDYVELLDDLETAMHHHQREGVPMCLYGHSFGAQITLNYLLQRRPPVAGAIIASPLLKLGFQPSPVKVVLAKLLLKLWPSFTQSGPNDRTLLTRDLAFLDSLPSPELLHHKVSARMYHEIIEGARRAREGASRYDCPMLVIQGEEDTMISVAATRDFFEALAVADKTLRMHPGMKHETQNEIGRETVLAEMVEWMDKRLPA